MYNIYIFVELNDAINSYMTQTSTNVSKVNFYVIIVLKSFLSHPFTEISLKIETSVGFLYVGRSSVKSMLSIRIVLIYSWSYFVHNFASQPINEGV